MSSIEDYAKQAVGAVSGFFGWDTPNDQAVIPSTASSTPPATNASAQPQQVAPAGNKGSVFSVVPTWEWVAGGLVLAGVIYLIARS